MVKKKKKRKRLKIKRLLYFLIFILLVIVVIYCLLFIKVHNYYIYNNSFLSDEEVLKELKLNKNSSFVLVSDLFKKNEVKKSNYIKSIKIKRTFNLEVKIYVEEYRVLFYDENKKKAVIENGSIIEYNDNNLPVLKNKIDDEQVYKNFVKRMYKVKDSSLDMISEITYSPNGIDKERFLFSMNDGNYVYVTITKLSKINDYKNIIESVENKKGILYLDYGNYFVPKE